LKIGCLAMKFGLFGISCVVALAELIPAAASAADIDALVNQLTQSLTEDIQRQRLKAQREDAEELRRAQLPDLSQFGTPVEGVDTGRRPARRRSIDCTTIDMGDGDSATHCD
jgi:hypothetical protein